MTAVPEKAPAPPVRFMMAMLALGMLLPNASRTRIVNVVDWSTVRFETDDEATAPRAIGTSRKVVRFFQVTETVMEPLRTGVRPPITATPLEGVYEVTAHPGRTSPARVMLSRKLVSVSHPCVVHAVPAELDTAQRGCSVAVAPEMVSERAEVPGVPDASSDEGGGTSILAGVTWTLTVPAMAGETTHDVEYSDGELAPPAALTETVKV